jgi:hypothetical protein
VTEDFWDYIDTLPPRDQVQTIKAMCLLLCATNDGGQIMNDKRFVQWIQGQKALIIEMNNEGKA